MLWVDEGMQGGGWMKGCSAVVGRRDAGLWVDGGMQCCGWMKGCRAVGGYRVVGG